MNQTLSLQQVICRPARERDLEEIREFCKTIWDGHDYVPEVLEDWFHDERGIFVVAEYEKRAIGCAKLTWLAEGQWWLEGFRVDPEYQGLKVGSLIHNYVDQWWREHGDGVLRLMTSSKNKSVHHLCESTGFTKIFEVRDYKAESVHEPVHTFTFALFNGKELERIVAFAVTRPSLAITNRVGDFGWRSIDLTHNTLFDLVTHNPGLKNNIFWWRGDQGLLIVWDDVESDEKAMGIGVLACTFEDMPTFLVDVRRLAAKQGRDSVFWVAPVHEQVHLALQQSGYSSDWEHTAFVFEKRHPRS